MASQTDNNDGTEGFKPSNPTDTTIARRGEKRQIDFPVSPSLKKAHPATPALTPALPATHDQASASAPTNLPNTTTNEYKEIKTKETGNNPPKGLLRAAYGKINLQKRAKKALQLNEFEKNELFMKHLQSFSAPEYCYNLQGGSIRKCTCLHILRDAKVRNAVAKWCVQFSEMKETEQNQIVLDWVRYARLTNPKRNTKMKCYLIPYHSDEVNNISLEPLQNSPVCTSAIMAICGIGEKRWSEIIGRSKKSSQVKPHGNNENSNAKIKADNPVIKNLTEHFKKIEDMAEVVATRTVREITGEITL